MSSPLASNGDLAHSQTSPAIPPSRTESPDMPGAPEKAQSSREEQLETGQNNIRQSESPIVDQANECGTPKREDSLETDTANVSSTPVTSSNLPDVATPRSSVSPELEVTPFGADCSRSKRSHAEMAGPSSDEIHASRKVARLSEPLPDTQEIDDLFVADPSVGQTPKTNKRSHIASAGSDEDEEPPTKKRRAREARVRDLSPEELIEEQNSSHIASAGPDGEDEEEPPTKKKGAREARVTRDLSPAESVNEANVLDHPTLCESSLDLETPTSTTCSKETVDPRRPHRQPPRQSDQPTATTPSQPPPLKSYLHTLPGELRNRIYLHLGLRSGRLDLNGIAHPALIVAYPDLKDELLSVMLSDNKLSVPVYSDFRIKASEAPSHPVERSSVGPYQVGTLAIGPRNWIKKIDPHFVAIKHIGLRIWEAPKEGFGTNKLICDYFLNVKTNKGKPTTVSHMSKLWATTATKRESRAMCDLATARAKRFAKQDGFRGFTWEQAQELAGSFASVLEAKSHFTKVKGKVVLNEGIAGDLA